ncbi:putative amidase domain protein [Peptococcaceae bacterium CEB3]|nr:putative amidase domain protein [Peptococcaceae bacterium CEB3]
MKKEIVKGSMLVFMVMLIMTCLVPVSLANVNTVATTGYSDLSAAEVTTIGGVLNNILSSELNIVKTRTTKDYSSVINDNKLLQLIQETEKFKEKWYKDVNFKIYGYKSNVKINNATKLSGNNYMLDVTFKAELTLGKDFPIHPQMSDNYVCQVENKSGQWVVDKLINKADYADMIQVENPNNKLTSINDSDVLADNRAILDTKLKGLEARSANIYQLEKNYEAIAKNKVKETLSGNSVKASFSAASYSGINRQAVVNYAEKYALNYNPAYPSYSADCTNFASQAVYAGGVPATTTWYSGSYDWVNVGGFHDYMINNGYAKEIALNSNDKNGASEDISLGDIIQWEEPLAIFYSHSTIATYDSDTYGWLLCAHTNNRLNYPMSMYFSQFSSDRDVHFW